MGWNQGGIFCKTKIKQTFIILPSQTVRAQKQIPALPRLSRYMNRNYKLDKETTQRLLDLAVEDNLIKLHKKVGTKGNKAGVEEDAFRLPSEDMLPYERHDWYCFHCHCKSGEIRVSYSEIV